MRWPSSKMRFIWAFLCGALLSLAVSIVFLGNSCSAPHETHYLPHASASSFHNQPSSGNASADASLPIKCIVNGDRQRPISCLQKNDDVFVPFALVERYFEISGKVETDKKSGNSEKVFNWQHSYAKLSLPKLPYEPDGIFMSFDNYNVEVRDRVKCISAMEGVPLSSQWTTGGGHFYPIQVAQFGLSHYSKNISEEAPRKTVIANFQQRGSWAVPAVESDEQRSFVWNFTLPESVSGPDVVLDEFPDSGDPYIIFSVKFRTHGSVTLQLEVQDKKQITYELIYTCSNESIWAEGNRIFYGIGADCTNWISLVRDIYVDLVKGLTLGIKKINKKDKVRPNITRIRIIRMVLHGQGHLDKVVTQTTAHSELFYVAADWLVRHQVRQTGGWPISVKRKLGASELQPGWFSAMAQGQAMSTLTRAYRKSGSAAYLEAAVRALDLFGKSAAEGGITAVFLDKYVWYEEYPTKPPSFVLNGFIYALLGLYDVSLTATGEDQKRAHNLFADGVASLKALLPLFDTGSGSTYDLRHFTLKSLPNIARWDYHATHVTQLLVMNSIAPDEMFQSFAQRWSEYMSGKRAPHN
ncbi:D-glucuronyl C5-epimerase [Hypsibius exemplaris]|uniref:heparosan-N-sulfate-glucuronate 5-epimerase n=1 Tax=Hypsibius exemplaris TaxID=2072580 RepID=A0A1W0WT53_HYPEX|nr:D-glucuronyl C5-epimerase [Hypsibius exemplaris]